MLFRRDLDFADAPKTGAWPPTGRTQVDREAAVLDPAEPADEVDDGVQRQMALPVVPDILHFGRATAGAPRAARASKERRDHRGSAEVRGQVDTYLHGSDAL